MNFVRRMTAGRGMTSRSERTTRSCSASTISALPSMTSRSARRMGTMVRGSNDAFRARQPRITYASSHRYTEPMGGWHAQQEIESSSLRLCERAGGHTGCARPPCCIVEARAGAVALRVVEILLAHADVPGQGERPHDVCHLLTRVPIGAEREADSCGVRASHEALVHRVAIRELECDACRGERAHGTLLELFRPPFLEGNVVDRRRSDRGMREDVHRHLASEALERGNVRVHV